MNLHAIAGPVIAAINSPQPVTLRQSTGYTTNADGSQTPTYRIATGVQAQIQSLTFRDIQQIDSLNLQGLRRAIYLFGDVEGLVRSTNQGGDLITFPDGTVWLVAMVLETWGPPGNYEWCKVAVTLQVK